MAETFHLPGINRVGVLAPLDWLALGWRDLSRAPFACLIYGVGLAVLSMAVTATLYLTGQFTWFLVLAGGFLIIAPILGMGLYRAARQLECGETPGLASMIVQPGMLRADRIMLGVALFVLFGIWVEAAYIIYGLSTRAVHQDVFAFLNFLLTTPEGWQMAMIGSAVGGAIAFLAFTIVVISAPMLLEPESDFFISVISSVRAVLANFPTMLFWAFLIAGLTVLGIATAMVGLALVFPWIGLSSWHAYRALVVSQATAAA